MLDHRDRDRAQSFGTVAHSYDSHRPRYPPSLITQLLEDRPERTLDVGCGTGILGRALADAGAEVLGLEPDPQMAEVARSKGLRVEVAPFEDFRDDRRFDLIVAGTSWHWVDPVAGAHTAARLLNDGGRLALAWMSPSLSPETTSLLLPAYEAHAPGLAAEASMHTPHQVDATAVVAPLLRHPWRDQEHEVITDMRSMSAADWLELRFTMSSHFSLDPAARVALREALTHVLRGHDEISVKYDCLVISARCSRNP